MIAGRRYERSDAVRISRSPWLSFAPFAGIVPLLAYLFADRRHMPDSLSLLVGLAAIVAPVLAVVAAAARAKPRIERGALRTDEEGLHWNGVLGWPRAKIAHGMLVPGTESGTVVRLTDALRMRTMDLVVEDEFAGQALLDSLHLGATRRTAHFVAHAATSGIAIGSGSMLLGIFGAYFALRVLLHSVASPLAWMLAMLSVSLPYLPLALAAAPTRIVVGVDGVLLRRLGRERFIAYRDVERCESYEQGVVMVLRDGRDVKLRVGPIETRVDSIRSEQVAQREALLARLGAAMRAHGGGVDDGDGSLRALERGGRSIREWMTHLRSLAARHEGGMRIAPVLRSQLWALLTDPNAAPSERAGAAVTLAQSGADEEETHERLRVAAGAVAEPKLRVAIEAVARGDDAKVEKALAALDAPPRDERERAE